MATFGGHGFFGATGLQLCFIDEAGDLGVLGNPPAANDQPVLVVAGLFVDAAELPGLTHDYLDLKHRFFPEMNHRSRRRLDRILPEIKGAELRKDATRGNARKRRRAIGFLDRTMSLLRRHDVRLVARIWVKAPGSRFEGTAVYASSIQGLCTYFEHYLNGRDSSGLCIADSRSKSKNLRVSHSIFTQKFGAAPNYERLLELPTFGHSENHAGLQICDIVCSGLLYPIACYAYCSGHVNNVHVQPAAARLRSRYGQQLRELQHRYYGRGRYVGGVTVADNLNQRSGALMFGSQAPGK